MVTTIAADVRSYLAKSRNKYERGESEYYARVALYEAVEAYCQGNYGIGAVAVVVTENRVAEFRGRNAMVTGNGIVDHAETRALLKHATGRAPDAHYSRSLSEATRGLPVGLSVYGTIEPCPLCTIALTNAGASYSLSTALDGELVSDGEYVVSDGGANALGAKSRTQPRVWQHIQNGIGISFSLLESSDAELKALSLAIFLETRKEIDEHLARKRTIRLHRAFAFPWRR